MDCPRCGKPIGGYVTAGSIQSARVAKGCCPHCGSSMPRGYKVGYASSFEPKTQKYDTSAIRILRRKSWIKGLFTFLNGIVCGFFSALEEGIVGGVTIAALFGIAALLVYIVWTKVKASISDLEQMKIYNRSKAKWETSETPVGNGLLIFSFFVSAIVSLAVYFAKDPGVVRGLCVFGAYAVLFIAQFWAWKQNYRWAMDERPKEKEREKVDVLRGIISSGQAKCGLCGNEIGKHFSAAFSGDGAAVLCEKCMPWKKGKTTKIGEMEFRHYVL